MPVDKRKVTIKTLLMAVAIPLLVIGVQQFMGGGTLQGAVAVVIGVAAAAIYVAFDEYDIPYEPEIRELVRESDITVEDVQGLTEEIASQVDERVDASGAGGDG